jgi:hypothetical protein
MKQSLVVASIFAVVVSFLLYQPHVLGLLSLAYDHVLALSKSHASNLGIYQLSTSSNPQTRVVGKTEAEDILADSMSIPRAIRKVFLAIEQAEGAGARVRRSVGTAQLRNFSPFLMLDHFTIKPGAGFPDQ